MTRKDYILLADAIASVTYKYKNLGIYKDQKVGIEAIALQIAIQLQQDNYRFDKARFLKACELEDKAE